MNVRFATCGDYTEMAVRLFKSIKHAHPDAKMHYVCLGDEDRHVGRMRQLDVEVKTVGDPLWSLAWSKFGGDKPAACRAWRTLQILDLLSEYQEPVLWLDSDSVVRRSLGDLVMQVGDYDMAVCVRGDIPPKNDARNRVLSGVVLITPSSAAKRLVIRWCQLCDNVCDWGLHTDQRALWRAILELRPRVLELCPAEYNDWYGYTQGGDPYIVSWPSGAWHKAGWTELSEWAEALYPDV